MPERPFKPCAKQGCGKLTRNRYCDQHQRSTRPEARPNSNARGYTYRWSKAAKAFLRQQPWCSECARAGIYTLAELVDHIIPHKGDAILFWDKTNWQSLCGRCHSKKTVQEDGGFGRPPHAENKKGGGQNHKRLATRENALNEIWEKITEMRGYFY